MAVGVFFGGESFGGGFFGAGSPSPSPAATSGGGGGTGHATINWQEQPRRKRRYRNQELFDELAQTLRELVHPTPDLPEPTPVATASAIADTLQRLHALAETTALQAQVASLKHEVEMYRRHQEQILAEQEDDELLLLM